MAVKPCVIDEDVDASIEEIGGSANCPLHCYSIFVCAHLSQKAPDGKRSTFQTRGVAAIRIMSFQYVVKIPKYSPVCSAMS